MAVLFIKNYLACPLYSFKMLPLKSRRCPTGPYLNLPCTHSSQGLDLARDCSDSFPWLAQGMD